MTCQLRASCERGLRPKRRGARRLKTWSMRSISVRTCFGLSARTRATRRLPSNRSDTVRRGSRGSWSITSNDVASSIVSGKLSWMMHAPSKNNETNAMLSVLYSVHQISSTPCLASESNCLISPISSSGRFAGTSVLLEHGRHRARRCREGDSESSARRATRRKACCKNGRLAAQRPFAKRTLRSCKAANHRRERRRPSGSEAPLARQPREELAFSTSVGASKLPREVRVRVRALDPS